MSTHHLTYPSQVLSQQQSEINQKLSFDAFSRLRVSQCYGLLESKFITSKMDYVWEDVTDSSGVVTYVSGESSVLLEVGTGSGDFCLRQTYKYFPYISGNSQRILLTGNFKGKETGRVKRIGSFDNSNGIYFELASDDLYAVIRSKINGTVENNRIHRLNFNVDRLDGTGPSGIVMDFTKRQIFLIQYQWLGVGSVGFGFSYLGNIYLCHIEHHANLGEAVYMSTPNLPIRYEIRNVGTVSGTGSMKQICASVASEGGYQVPGLDFSEGTKSTPKAITNLNRNLMFAIRLKNTLNSKDNRRVARLKQFDCFSLSGNAFFELVHVSGISSTTANWNDVEGDSGIEYSTNISAFTSTHAHRIDSQYTAAGVGGTGSSKAPSTYTSLDHFLSIAQNYSCTQSQMFVVYVTSLSGNLSAFTNLSWTEFE